MEKLLIKKISSLAQIPVRQKVGDSGMDLKSVEKLTLNPGEIKAVATGWQMEVPDGYEIQVRTRSGLALKHGVMVLNSPGTVDSNYRGEVKVILANFGSLPFNIEVGDRMAQMVIAKVEVITPIEVDVLSNTERNDGGFGSTGVN